MSTRFLDSSDRPIWRAGALNEQTAVTLLLVAAFLIPSTLIIGPLGDIGVPSLLVSGVLLLLWVAGRLDPGLGTDLLRQPMRYLILLFVMVVLASYIAGQVRGLSPLEASGSDAALFGLACQMGIVLFVADAVQGLAGVVRILQQIVWGGVVLAFAGLLEFLGVANLYQTLRLPGFTYKFTEDVDALARSGFHRVQGLAGHPIEYAVVLGMILPLALHFALHARPGRRAMWWVATGMIAVGLPLAVSRSGMVTVAVSMALYLATIRLRWMLNLLPVAVCGLVGLAAMVPGLLGSIRSMFLPTTVETDPSIAGRTDDYSAVFTVWHAHPLFGLGPGTYVPALYRILDNEYLYTLATMGACGVLVEISILACGYSMARRARRRSTDPAVRSMAQAVASAIAGGMVGAFTFDAFGYKIMAVTTFVLIGCAAALWRIKVRDNPDRLRLAQSKMFVPVDNPAKGRRTPSNA
ncbi:MAG TPA: O-antigen ligase family protein [Amycolatopsis sp.]|nr:O-antigen ligase family protein [Amycolatopsis sp.]